MLRILIRMLFYLCIYLRPVAAMPSILLRLLALVYNILFFCLFLSSSHSSSAAAPNSHFDILLNPARLLRRFSSEHAAATHILTSHLNSERTSLVEESTQELCGGMTSNMK